MVSERGRTLNAFLIVDPAKAIYSVLSSWSIYIYASPPVRPSVRPSVWESFLRFVLA